MQIIRKDAVEYIEDYVNQKRGVATTYDEREFERIYKYSTLQYFHEQLGISGERLN